ncbi:hypothetical protein ACFSX9_06485 [Flavobacterium ardleyense]|uniref:Uncharacterized protein n=1 Tax=Flavobacterium ardleyense TaxID=2038737 RepID=A0ABW5Z6J8_9FLAO
MTKNLKSLNKELTAKLAEFRKHSIKNETKAKKKGFLNKFFNPVLNDVSS